MAPDDVSRVEATAADSPAEQSPVNEKVFPDDKVSQFVVAHQHLPPMTPEIEKTIKKKIDAWMIPLVSSPIYDNIHATHLCLAVQLLFTTTLAAVDKVQLSTAALYDFREDNNLSGDQFAWLGSVLSVGVSDIFLKTSLVMLKYADLSLAATRRLVSRPLRYSTTTSWQTVMLWKFVLVFIDSLIRGM